MAVPAPIARSTLLTLGALIAISALAVDISLPAVPPMALALNAPVAHTQWVISLYLLGFGLGQIPIGLAGDRFGRRPTIAIGLTVYVVCAVVCALANQLWLILLARFVQGFGGAVGPVLARAIARDLAGGQEGARLQSVLLAILTTAPLLAPLLGSGLIAGFGWRSTFFALVLLGTLTLLLCHRYLPETGSADRGNTARQDLADGFRSFFQKRQCWCLAAIVVFISSGYFTMLTQASAVANDVFAIGPEKFGSLFAFVAVSFLVGTLISRWALRFANPVTLINAGMTVFVLFGVSVLAYGALKVVNGWWFWSSVSVYMLGMGLLGPSVMAAILEPLPKMSGRAASITGTLQMGVGASVGAIAATYYDGATGIMSWVMLVCAGLAALWWWGFARAQVKWV